MKKTIAVFICCALSMGLTVNTFASRSITDGKESAIATESGKTVDSVLTLIDADSLSVDGDNKVVAANSIIVDTNGNLDTIPVVSRQIKTLADVESVQIGLTINGQDASLVNTITKDSIAVYGNVETNKGTSVNVNGYEYLTSWYDLSAVVTNSEGQGALTHNVGEKVYVTLSIEELKGENPDNILMLLVQDDGDLVIVEVDTLNSKTGVMTATVDELGSIAIIKKMSLVSRNTDTSTAAVESVRSLLATQQKKDKDSALTGSYLTLKELITIKDNKNDWTDGETVALFNGIGTINIDPEKYINATDIRELAFVQGNNYIVNVKGISEITVNIEYAYTDVQELLKRANSVTDKTGINVDADEAAADPSKLTELGSFIIPGSFLMQIDYDGNVTYIYEPELAYEMLSVDESISDLDSSNEAAVNDSESATTDDQKLNTWTANIESDNTHEDYTEQELPVLTITGQMNPGGYCILFLPEEGYTPEN